MRALRHRLFRIGWKTDNPAVGRHFGSLPCCSPVQHISPKVPDSELRRDCIARAVLQDGHMDCPPLPAWVSNSTRNLSSIGNRLWLSSRTGAGAIDD